MGMNIDLHISQYEELSVSSTSYTSDEEEQFHDFTTVTIAVNAIDNGVDTGSVRLFIKNIEDADRLAFEFTNLARTLRESYVNIGEKKEKTV